MTLVEYAKLLRPLIEKAVQSLSDNDALSGVALFPHWRLAFTILSAKRYSIMVCFILSYWRTHHKKTGRPQKHTVYAQKC